MDDNAPCHRTVAAEQLLESRRLAARTLPPVTIRSLRLALQDECSAMPQQLIHTLILSMGRRCETCLAVRNRDYTGMWVRLGSTDLMAGKVMFLRSNQGDRLDGNRDYTGMWVRLGSTNLMAGKVMFLRSNQGDRLDGNESVADSFRSDLVGFKSWSGRIIGAFLPSYVCQKKPPVRNRTRYPGSPLRHSCSHQISTTLVKFNVSFTNMLIDKYNCYHYMIGLLI
ncbi:hypothetical protein TNCV_637021 [Trichonephila clavipes]|nr:hypothetical protein TNCV_637021 [Trichonephila clavipes]